MNMLKAKLLVVRRHWFQQGQIAERERIITIIKEEYGATMAGYEGPDWMIALIEGETNGNI